MILVAHHLVYYPLRCDEEETAMFRLNFVVMVDVNGEPEAELYRTASGWDVAFRDGSKAAMVIDEMPDHWVEQFRRWSIACKKLSS